VCVRVCVWGNVLLLVEINRMVGRLDITGEGWVSIYIYRYICIYIPRRALFERPPEASPPRQTAPDP